MIKVKERLPMPILTENGCNETLRHLQIQQGEQQEHDYSMSRYQQAFGYTIEEVSKVIGDMALNGGMKQFLPWEMTCH